jgi:hypothetical protein
MQRAQHFEVRAEQIFLAALARLPGDPHGVVHRQQRQQVIALLRQSALARRQAERIAHRIVEPHAAVVRAGQMRRIGSQQQHRIEAAPARGGKMGEQYRAIYRRVAEGVCVELLRQPVAPFGAAETRVVRRQLLLPGLQRLQQLRACRVCRQTLQHAEDGQAVIQRAQPAAQRVAVFAQCLRRLAQPHQRHLHFVLAVRQIEKCVEARSHTVFAHQLFELIHHPLAFLCRLIGEDER